MRRSLILHYGTICYWCGKELRVAERRERIPRTISDYDVNIVTIDHKVPLHMGGNNRRENLCLSCISCNNLRNERQHIYNAIQFHYKLGNVFINLPEKYVAFKEKALNLVPEEYWYRFYDIHKDSFKKDKDTCVLQQFPVVQHIEGKGVWLKTEDKFGLVTTRWAPYKTTKAKFAYATIAEAKTAYCDEKLRVIGLYQRYIYSLLKIVEKVEQND
jgi:hypothetical protein